MYPCYNSTSVPSQNLDLHHLCYGFYVVSNDLRWEVVVGFVGIGGTIDHHCLNLSFHYQIVCLCIKCDVQHAQKFKVQMQETFTSFISYILKQREITWTWLVNGWWISHFYWMVKWCGSSFMMVSMFLFTFLFLKCRQLKETKITFKIKNKLITINMWLGHTIMSSEGVIVVVV